jgi:hypothetical protein
LHTLHLPNLFLLGISPCVVLDLVVSFTTSPSLSKTELVCTFYSVFEFGGFTGSFLREVFHLFLFGILSLIPYWGFYDLHSIDIFLSFSKKP